MANDRAIAILDSGVGGLTVVKEVMRQLPQETIHYFGDTARAPYGPRTDAEVRRFTREIVEYLMKYDPKMIVIACNTATAAAIDDIRGAVPVPVLGVIGPGAREAVKATRNGRIGVIGTDGTVRSGAYVSALKRIAPHVRVVSLACPAFVPLVEKGLYRSDEARSAVCEALEPLREEPIDTLILGCTHYPFLTDVIQACMGRHVAIISSAEQTARDISTLLYQSGQLASCGNVPVHRFFCSGDAETFRRIAVEWLNEPVRLHPVVWQGAGV